MSAAADGAAARPLQLEGVGRRFGALEALDAIDLAVAAGERRAILGANGAGKTTLFNVITGELAPSRGRVLLFGEDVTRLPPHQRVRRGLRRTYQKSLLFVGLTVLENLHVAVRGVRGGRFSARRIGGADAEEARGLAARVGLDGALDRPVRDLSHGQQRQLELGLALAGRPRLILLDEPAAGLSPAERALLVRLLHALPRDVTLVLIEHDMEVALQVADLVTVMHNGRRMAEGAPAEIQADQTVHDIYMGRHVR